MEQEIYYMSWEEFDTISRNILSIIKNKKIEIDTIVPVLRGGGPLGTYLSNNLQNTDISYIHVRRSDSDDANAFLGTPVLKGITNAEKIKGKKLLIVDDLLDKGVTMEFVCEELKKLEPESIHIAVLYNFANLENDEMYIVGDKMAEKKWIVFPWEKKD